MKKLQNRYSLFIRYITLFFILFGLFIVIYFGLSKPFNDGSGIPNAILFGEYGAFIGGLVGVIFSLVAIILLYDTLKAQQQAIKNQQNSFEIELFEKTFFNLIKSQNNITEGIKAYFRSLRNNLSSVSKVVHGREFFIYSASELRKIWLSIESENYLGMPHDDDDYKMFVNEEIHECYDPSSPKYSHPEEAQAKAERIIRKEKLRHTNKEYNINEILWKEIKEKEMEHRLSAIYDLFFQKYHYVIGHYFRNLYHIIKFAAEFNPTNTNHENVSRKYIGFVQAQMSSFELMLLFYNATKFGNALNLIKQFNFLENLAEEDLIDKSHNCIEGIKLKSRKHC